MSNYYKEYLNTHEVYVQRRLKTIENFIEDIQIIDECIGFQVWLDDEIAKILNSNEDKFISLNQEAEDISKQTAISFLLYRRNHQYLYSAYELAYAGLCEPSYSIMRTIHETILSMWYVATHQNKSKDVLEYMRNSKRKGIKYNHNYLVQSLYTGELEKLMRKIYSDLSYKSHSNIFGMSTTEKYNKKQIKDCFWSIKTQSCYNIITVIENLVQNKDLYNILPTKEICIFVERLKNNISGTEKTKYDYFPNKGNLRGLPRNHQYFT